MEKNEFIKKEQPEAEKKMRTEILDLIKEKITKGNEYYDKYKYIALPVKLYDEIHDELEHIEDKYTGNKSYTVGRPDAIPIFDNVNWFSKDDEYLVDKTIKYILVPGVPISEKK